MSTGADMLVTGGRACARAARLLASPSRAEVHSVFATSMNLLVDGVLVHVGPASLPLSFTGLAIDDRTLAAFLPSVRRGDAALVRSGALWVCGRSARLGIALGSLKAVDLSVRSLRASAEALGTLGEVLRCRAPRRPCGLEGDGALVRAERLLAQASPSEGELARAASLLVGRGPGLTPSGDDVLTGYGLGMWLMGEEGPYSRVLLAAVARKGTTDVSLGQLRAIAEGRASEPLHTLATTLADHAPAGLVERAVEGIESVGHTSGADALRGLAIACERARAARAAGHLSAVGW